MQALLTVNSPAPDIRLPGMPLLRRLLGANPEFCLHSSATPGRDAAEAYVADCFARAYGAEVTEFAPHLLAVKCAGNISGVAGIRPADQPLFSERYLDAPVEIVLADLYGRRVSRAEVFELCNLAALRPGVCQLMYMVMAAFLYQAGFRYVVFAGTAQVERTVRKMSFALTPIAPADPARLGESAARWGSYYETNPQVMAIDIAASMRGFDKLSLHTAVFDIYSEQVEALVRQFGSPQNSLTAPDEFPATRQTSACFPRGENRV